MIEQRVAPSDQGAVERKFLRRLQGGFRLVDAKSDSAGHADAPQLLEGATTAVTQLFPINRSGLAMPAAANIVHEKDIDTIETEPLLAVLERSHDPIVGIIKCVTKRQAVDPPDAVVGTRCGKSAGGLEHPPDLGAKRDLIPEAQCA
jgi:hypothetical protein